MKKMIIGVAGLMMIGLIIAIIFYQNSTPITPLQHVNGESQNELEQAQSEPLQPIYENEAIAYSLQNNKLSITFDNGNSWIRVPVEKDQLFNGRYDGDKQELIDHSYVLTENRVAFLYSGGSNEDRDVNRILLTYSLDQGKTWQDAVVTESYSAPGFRKIDFTSDDFGYVIISGERVVSQELSNIYVTNDGGENWEKINHPDTMSLVYDGGFIDETNGFLSVGPINPTGPDLYVTQDGGNTWSEAKVNMPTKYTEIFLIAEMPIKEEDHLAVFINQGPQGDYKGGQVKGKFISEDDGKTWEFLVEVKPNEKEAE